MSPERASMAYPFITRRQVAERLDRDPEFVRECIGILHRRFVDRDILPPPAGWMSSHRKLGEAIAARLVSPDFTAGDIATAAKLAKRYGKQLCKVFRDEQLAQEPGLAVAAAIFGVARVDREDADAGDDPYADTDRDEVEHGEVHDASESSDHAPPPAATAQEEQPARRRPGRPKGSKNKPKPEAVPKRGKRGGRR